jgi:hypothetical protein
MRSRPGAWGRRYGNPASGAGIGEIPASAGRRPRAGYASRHSGGSGAPPAGHYEPAARSSLTEGRKCLAGRKVPESAARSRCPSHRTEGHRRMWSAERRASRSHGTRRASPARRSRRWYGATVRLPALRSPHVEGENRMTANPAPQTIRAAQRWLRSLSRHSGREPTGPREARPDDRLRERARNPYLSLPAYGFRARRCAARRNDDDGRRSVG